MQKNCLELSVYINGKPVREYLHKSRHYIEGRQNTEFELYLKNNSSKRVEAIFSVDGLDVLDGKTANSKKTGYLIPAWGSIRIDGWRLNDTEVARFQFASQEKSYASAKGSPRNIGVIGVAVFNEKQAIRIPWYGNWWQNHSQLCGGQLGDFTKGRRGTGNAEPFITWNDSTNVSFNSGEVKCSNTLGSSRGVSMTNASQGLGTAFGRVAESKVTTVHFERESEQPNEILELRYNDAENLELLGIKIGQPLSKTLQDRETAKPFEDIGGCEPPPGWNR